MNDARQDETILIVEDSQTQAVQLQHLLMQHGYGVFVAHNGRDALASIRSAVPSLVISDIVMPGMDGYQLCSAIRADETLRAVPVMLLTSLSSAKDIILALECGADTFITKPYEEGYLLSKIKTILSPANHFDSDRKSVETSITYQGDAFRINSDLPRIIDLLISTYESSVIKNRELLDTQKKLSDNIAELEAALEKVKQLEGIIPICMYCKKIRDDKDYWHNLEHFITDHSEAVFSHGMCPDCFERAVKAISGS